MPLRNAAIAIGWAMLGALAFITGITWGELRRVRQRDRP